MLRAIHTPGHRPEHTCLAVIDRSRADEPWLVLTGDSLFVGDAARPDLAVGAQEGAEGLFHSLRRLLELPDGVEVFPGHVAGSLCGKAMSSKASSTIGFERRFNPALQIEDETEFVAESAAVSAPKPPNMARLVELNRGPLVGAAAEVGELPAPPAGATVLDVRPVADYLAGHGHGALNVPVSGTSFATKAGFVLDPEAPIVVQARDAAEAERRCAGSARSASSSSRATCSAAARSRWRRSSLDELDALLEEGAELIDVRERDERDGGYIAGSRNIPYRLLPVAGADVPTDRPVVTICESGARAGIAASILAAKGIDARPGARRRHRRLGGPRRPDGRVPPLRLVTRTGRRAVARWGLRGGCTADAQPDRATGVERLVFLKHKPRFGTLSAHPRRPPVTRAAGTLEACASRALDHRARACGNSSPRSTRTTPRGRDLAARWRNRCKARTSATELPAHPAPRRGRAAPARRPPRAAGRDQGRAATRSPQAARQATTTRSGACSTLRPSWPTRRLVFQKHKASFGSRAPPG